ncbi:MAG: Gfo/Idh/MocA family oxidoreductase [Tyzzerella sp.]|nr:Gfo/Idh/MocA family oxidoreductase [Tyzzerella sp.]
MNKVCIIGCGMIAQSAHIPAYKHWSDDFEIVAVCDAFEASAKKVAEEHDIPNYYSNAEEMLKEMKPDVVSICTPNMMHKEFAMLALSYGANVLCEKPLAFSYADACEMFAYAEKQGKMLMACQSIRFLPERLAAKKLVDEGKVGDVYYAELSRIRRRGIPTWGKFHLKEYSGGGALIDIGVHGFDSVLWLMGNPKPRSVIASMSKIHADEIGSAKSSGAFKDNVDTSNFNPDEMNVESFAQGQVTFENGASLSFKISWAANLKEENNIVLAGKACGIDMENKKIYAGAEDIFDLEVGPSGFEDEPFYGHFCLIKNVAEVLSGKAEAFVKPQETINTTAILEAAYLSAAENREVMIEELL